MHKKSDVETGDYLPGKTGFRQVRTLLFMRKQNPHIREVVWLTGYFKTAYSCATARDFHAIPLCQSIQDNRCVGTAKVDKDCDQTSKRILFSELAMKE